VDEEPPALLVLDVGADLADLLARPVAVEVIVLGLEVHAHDEQDLAGDVVRLCVWGEGVG